MIRAEQKWTFAFVAGMQHDSYSSPRCRGAHFTMSSTLMIISAASVADPRIACFTLNASKMPQLCVGKRRLSARPPRVAH